tara:strand:- start:1067 stop:1357 length:291 start_codon:yes stop_codon:yes gene_type:complete
MVISPSKYDEIAETFWENTYGRADREERYPTEPAMISGRCYPKYCGFVRDMSTSFEKDDQSFNWRDFMSNAGCFGWKQKQIQTRMKKIPYDPEDEW